ncbi:hypothetical protein NMG60_11005963 [Bertholletia excelsa]
MEGPDTFSSFPSLLCQENESSLNECGEAEWTINPNLCSDSESEEYIRELINREGSLGFNNRLSAGVCPVQSDESWWKSARLSAVKWIFNTRACFGFRFSTALLSLTYFDRFISKRSIDNGKLWAVRLLSVACLSLAAKMEESKSPALSQYQIDDFNFGSSVIQRMELMVLNTLNWKLLSITPFSYLHFFISKLCPQQPVSEATELILAIAEAVLAVSDSQLTIKMLDLKMIAISPIGSLNKEDVYSCYNLMREIKMGKSDTPKSVILASSMNSLDYASVTFGVGRKRRLTHNDSDEHRSLQKFFD